MSLIVLLAGGLSVAACAGVQADPPAALPVAAGSPSPSPGTGPQTHPLGDAVPANSGFVAATVFGYTQPAASGAAAPQAGQEWGAADVQACAEAGSVFPVTVTDAPWSLLLDDHTAIMPTRASAAQFPQPQYPSTPRGVQAGQCVRAWIMFAVPAGRRPRLIRYAPQGATPVDWRIQ